jgi:hypothetical protein
MNVTINSPFPEHLLELHQSMQQVDHHSTNASINATIITSIHQCNNRCINKCNNKFTIPFPSLHISLTRAVPELTESLPFQTITPDCNSGSGNVYSSLRNSNSVFGQ